MGMRIDPAGRDQQSVRADFAPARPRLAADLADAVAVDGEVTGEAWTAGAVDDGAAADDGVMHHALPSFWTFLPAAIERPASHRGQAPPVPIPLRTRCDAPIIPSYSCRWAVCLVLLAQTREFPCRGKGRIKAAS